MRRKVKAGLIEADHADCAIVVHYEVEATVLGDMGEPIVAERQDNVKRIKLKTLNENTNIARLAQEMVEKCKLIHPSKLPLVERLLEELQEHQVSCLTLTLTPTLTLTLRRQGPCEDRILHDDPPGVLTLTLTLTQP